jgi:hypothetical protein
MSSWANIHIPRKRDISQIPAELRPSILPRVQQPQVILSESFQSFMSQDTLYDYSNMIINPASNVSSKKEVVKNPREYISKKIESTPSPGAFELVYNDKSYVFVILRHIRTPKDNDLWISSYNSIRKYYKNKIIIIDDNSQINTVNGRLYETEVIQSEFPGAGEILPYYYFLRNKWADTMIFLHDSMFLQRPFKDNELNHSIRFHWHFTSNGFDDQRKIGSYLSLLHNNKELMEFYQNQQSTWKGCSGGATIIDHQIVLSLEDKYNVFTLLTMAIKKRKDREAFERIVGILSYYEHLVNDQTTSNFGDILRYPGAFDSENNNPETASHIVTQRGYDTAILKVWRGR